MRSPGIEEKENVHHLRTVIDIRSNDPCVQDKRGDCPLAPPGFSTAAHPIRSQIWDADPEKTDHSDCRKSGKFTVVDISQTSARKQNSDSGTCFQHNNPNRCIPSWVGAVCQGTKTGGHWKKEEQQAHINFLGMKAAYLAIQSYLNACLLTESRFLLQMDNTTAVAYINKRGGTKSNKLTQLALDIWNICQSKKITLIAQHLPGIRNTEAGAESRHINNRIEWALDKQLFANIRKCYYKLQVDIFGSKLNHQLRCT